MKRKTCLIIFLLISTPLNYAFCENKTESKSTKKENNAITIQVEAFKKAIIDYINTHPGEFIGRSDAQELIDEPIIILEDPEDTDNKKYALAEFIIYPHNMTFQATYGFDSIEPYLYKGKFEQQEDGSIILKEVNLTRFHMFR